MQSNNVSSSCGSSGTYQVFNTEESLEPTTVQHSLVEAIKDDKSKAMFELLKSDLNNVLSEKDFLERSIAPMLSDENCRVRGLASLFLYMLVVDSKVELSPELLDDWAKAATNLDLKDNFRVESSSCSASIRVLGDQLYGENEDEGYGIVIATTPPKTITATVQRTDLEERYLVISGIGGKLWLQDIKSGKEEVHDLVPGRTYTIPSTSKVQYMNSGKTDLVMLVPTNPPYNVIGKRTDWNVEKTFEKGKW